MTKKHTYVFFITFDANWSLQMLHSGPLKPLKCVAAEFGSVVMLPGWNGTKI